MFFCVVGYRPIVLSISEVDVLYKFMIHLHGDTDDIDMDSNDDSKAPGTCLGVI